MIQQLACMQRAVSFSSARTLHKRHIYQWKLQHIAPINKDCDM